MESSDKDEIRRLRRIIARLEAATGTTVITTEIVPRDDRPGWVLYVTAPTMTSEVEFGMAIYSQVMSAFQVKGLTSEHDFANTDQVAQPEGVPALDLYAWIGKDEFGSGEIGIKQGLVPAGLIPMVSIDRGKLEKYWQSAEAQAEAYGQKISLMRFRAVEVVRKTEAGVPQ